MIKKVIQPSGKISFFGTKPVTVQRAFTETEVKEAICAFIIDYFFEFKHGSMELPGTSYNRYETVTEDAACDLVGEFWEAYRMIGQPAPEFDFD